MATSIAHPSARRVEERRLHAISSLPDPIVRLEEHFRLIHRDLALLDGVQLQREHYRARHTVMLEELSVPWLAERLVALEAELRGRGGR